MWGVVGGHFGFESNTCIKKLIIQLFWIVLPALKASLAYTASVLLLTRPLENDINFTGSLLSSNGLLSVSYTDTFSTASKSLLICEFVNYLCHLLVLSLLSRGLSTLEKCLSVAIQRVNPESSFLIRPLLTSPSDLQDLIRVCSMNISTQTPDHS